MPKVKKLVLGSLLLAITIVVERLISIQTPILRISFTYVPVMFSGILLGPLWGAGIYTIADIIGATLISKGYVFFPGYTLSALITGLIYGLFLHNRKSNQLLSNKSFLIRLLISNFLVLLFVHVGLTSLWIIVTGVIDVKGINIISALKEANLSDVIHKIFAGEKYSTYKASNKILAFQIFAITRFISASIRFPIEVSTIFLLKISLEKPMKKFLSSIESSEQDEEDKTITGSNGSYDKH